MITPTMEAAISTPSTLPYSTWPPSSAYIAAPISAQLTALCESVSRSLSLAKITRFARPAAATPLSVMTSGRFTPMRAHSLSSA